MSRGLTVPGKSSFYMCWEQKPHCRRVLSCAWRLSSLLSASCRRETTDFPEFSLFWWLQGCRVPTRLAVSSLERKGALDREKTKGFKNKKF